MSREIKHAAFGAELTRLMQAMGAPGLERIATASSKPGRTPLSTSRLSDWRRGRTLPDGWPALESLLLILAETTGTRLTTPQRQEWRARLAQARRAAGNASHGSVSAVPAGRRVGDADAVLLGVHRTGDTHEPLTPYVDRDADTHITAALLRADALGGLIVVKGDSTAGKTRSAVEAMRRLFPDRRLLLPRRRHPLDDTLASVTAEGDRGNRCVVWLDDLEGFLGPGLLDLTMLSQLTACRAIMIATMRLTEYNGRAPKRNGEGTGHDDAYATVDLSDPVLKAAEKVDLDRLWSPAEVRRAQAETDHRLGEALQHHRRYGVAEYVSAGPKLWDSWRNARYVGGNPRGHAVVATAIDLARAGLTRPLPTSLIRSLHGDYLAREQGTLLDPESFDSAMAWATKHRLGASRLLQPAGDEVWRPFEYLVDRVSQDDALPVPGTVQEAALEHAETPQEQFSVGVSCYRDERIGLAKRAFTPPAESGHIDSMLFLGSILLDQGKEGAAEKWWRRSAEAGNTTGMLNLGVRHSRAGRRRKAEKWWRKAHEAGLSEAATKLASILDDRGEHAEAERLWASALAAEVPDAFFHFGLLAYQRGDVDEAERYYLQGVERNHRESMTNLAQLYLGQHRYDEAERLYSVAAEAGDQVAMRGLGVLNEWRRRWIEPGESSEQRQASFAEALQKLFTGDISGSEWDADAEAAKYWYKRAYAHDDILSLRLLGNLYKRRGRWKKAVKCYAKAAEAGDAMSFAFFNQPTLAYAQPREFPVPPEEEEDHPWRPSPRTLRVLECALEYQADTGELDLNDLQGKPLTTRDWRHGVFTELPAQTWSMDLTWRREMIRCFDDLADDIRSGSAPYPRCTGEEMALHLALEHAAALTDDDPEFTDEFTAGIPEDPYDFAWSDCKDLLFEDHDVLMLYEPWSEGIDSPDNSVNQQMGMANLQPEKWFEPFRVTNRRDPDRGFRQ
ncbi:tetratricopeptide repeat protein [Streptomyces angustmyceticus]